jgi:hypothetical protein
LRWRKPGAGSRGYGAGNREEMAMATLGKPCDTHLRVHPKSIVNAASLAIPPDNTPGHRFYYDRQGGALFFVPDGWCFIVTDITVAAAPMQPPMPDPDRYILATVCFTNGGERHFNASVLHDVTAHYQLGGAFVIPGGHTPEFRNTTFSTSHAEARLLGYFLKGDALLPGESFFA